MVCTLPVISEELELNPLTDVMNYLPKINSKTGKPEHVHPAETNRVNFSNSTFLNFIDEIKKPVKGLETIRLRDNRVMSESFVLKGNFNGVDERFK